MNEFSSNRKMVILTEGRSDPISAKTAVCLLRYKPEEVVALLDSTQAGRTTQEVLDVGGKTPIIGSLDQAPDANALVIGIAPTGGIIPEEWRGVVLEAIIRGMDVISGLHDFFSDDPEFSQAAAASGVKLIDIRKNDERHVAYIKDVNDDCLRIHTVGHDCCVGKMVVALELSQEMQRRGVSSKFVATGQTGILIEGDGCPIDCVVSDFVSGSVEQLVLANQNHDVMFIEGQGSLAHPRYSGVTLGLLHGCRPHGMILCYEVGRHVHSGMQYVDLKSLVELRNVYETMASLMQPSKVIGVAMNSRKVTAEEAEIEREKVRSELGLPVCDVIRHGPGELIEAVNQLRPIAVNS